MVLSLDVPLASQRARLEKRVPKRLAEGRFGRGRGLAYLAEREALSLSVSGGDAVVDAPLRVEISECEGQRCKQVCDLKGVARAHVPLVLKPDYRFQPSRVNLRFTKGCSVRVLGFLTVSVTPQLEGLLEPELSKIARQIDDELPNVREHATRAWAELNRARQLPLGACLVLQPAGLIQGPIADSADFLKARFGVVAKPELRSACDARAKPSSLPALQTDPSLPEDGVVTLGMVVPLAELERAFTTAPQPGTERESRRVAEAKVSPRGREVDVELELAGRVCGRLAFAAQPSFEGEGEHIELSGLQLSSAERERWTAAGLEPTSTLVGLSASSRVAPPLSVQGLRAAIPVIGSAELAQGVALSTRLLSVRAAGAAARTSEGGAPELVAWIEARGSIRLAGTL